MVEGPGCKLKGLKIKAKLKGQTVKNVKGNAVDKYKKKGTDCVSPFHQLIGRQLDDVQTLGKELFMYFGDLCLRIHFLMNGQSFINNEKVDSEQGGKAETATLELQMSHDLLTFKQSSADVRQSSPCREKYEELNDLDICSPVFNFPRAVALVMEQQDRLVCDVLLDQSILPGVGNIIKNEALFDSGIKPSTKVHELKDDHISHLIKMTRDFTDIFYKCRRDGKPLYPYYKIYSKKKCRQCEGRVTICRLGDDNDRVTYFCDTCQNNDFKSKQRKLPAKGSLLGWVKTGKDAETMVPPVDWSCGICTLINKATSSTCSACLNPKGGTSVDSGTAKDSDDCVIIHDSSLSEASLSKKRTLSDSSENTHAPKVRKLNAGVANKISDDLYVTRNNSGNSGQENSVSKVKSNTQIHHLSPEQSYVSVQKAPSNNQSHLSLQTGKQQYSVRGQNNQSNSKTNNQSHLVKRNGVVSSSQSQQASQIEDSSKIPTCSTHKRKCNLKEVRKEGNNLGRWFFSCVVRNCNFFEWADEKFPLCPDHGKPCTIRTVMKIGPNNGRKFFACKMPRNKQCKFFEWAVGYD